jgi:Bromodomain/Cytosine specific DNA methyltransferase replication foci domain
MSSTGVCVPEGDVPPAFNVSHDDEGKPQRELEDFVVTRGTERTSVCSLDESSGSSAPARAVGLLRIPSTGKSLRTETGDLVEWCIEYGNVPSLWVRSADVWYRLGKPAADYAKTHDLARRRFELCSRIYILATTIESKQATFKSFTRLLGTEWNNMRAYKEKDIFAERSFILAQAKTLNETALNECLFFKELKAKKAPAPANGAPAAPAKRRKETTNNSKAAPTSSTVSSPGPTTPTLAGPWRPHEDLDEEAKSRLLKRMDKVVSSVMKMKNALPFLEPVDPERDGCPDYLERIKTPMDYGTIKNRIMTGKYYKSALQVADDARRVTENCILYNGEGHPFSKYAMELGRKFENQARAAEEAELKAMQKRLAASPPPPASTPVAGAKKARADEDKQAKSTGGGKPPSGSKGARGKAAKVTVPEGQGCVSTAGGGLCGKRARPGSRYCGDECGMAVARKKLQLLIKEGMDVDEYLQNCMGKALVGVNPLNR